MFSNYDIKQYESTRDDPNVGSFIKKYHYSKSIARGSKYVFVLYVDGTIHGVAQFGIPVGRNCQSYYSKTGGMVLELKRFVLAPTRLKNTASWFMAKCMRRLKLIKGIDSVLSYADPEEGHLGTIYKASNFQYRGLQKWQSKIVKYKRKFYHMRAVYQDSKTGRFIRELMKSGKAKVTYKEPKHIFVYSLI